MAEIDFDAHKGQPPVRTMCPDNLPFESLRNISRIGLAFNDDDQGNEASLVVQSMLPQARRIAPKGLSWNEVFVTERRQQQPEILEQKKRGVLADNVRVEPTNSSPLRSRSRWLLQAERLLVGPTRKISLQKLLRCADSKPRVLKSWKDALRNSSMSRN